MIINILNVFNQDAFNVVALTNAINDITPQYGRLGALGLFVDEGVTQPLVAVDFDPIWDSSGNRTAVKGLTNPFWIAVNCLLRALGLYGASSADQLAAFVLPSVCAGDGSGAAQIADDAVQPIIGPMFSGSVDAIILDTGGSNYLTPQVAFSGGGGTGALAEATVVDGIITEVQVTYGGSGYTSAPAIAITDAGGGASATAHATVSVSGSTEKQFRFQGVLAQQKPFRDWLTEILACGLGYFTWEFGKLKLGCRINASAVSAFTVGNMLFQSLRMEPIEAAFEHITIDFADQQFQYQANTAEYQDKSHAAYYGRSGSPLSANQHLVGCGTLSQALRLAAVRTREEIGGISPAEWRAARNASWKSTILALDTEVGQVVSVTHPDVPGGAGNFRIQSWRLNKDWSIDIMAKTVTTSMYDLTVGPKPVDVIPDPLPETATLTGDISTPPAPSFGVELSALDATVAEVAGLAFASATNTHSIDGAVFAFYYADPTAATAHLAANLGSSATSMSLDSAAGIVAGVYRQIGSEIVLCGTPSGTTVPITRAQLGSAAVAASIGAAVATVVQVRASAAFGGDFFNVDPHAPMWHMEQPLPGMRLLSVGAYATNVYGAGPVAYVCLTGNVDHGLILAENPSGGGSPAPSTVSTVNVTNADATIPTGNVLVNLTATTRDCTLILPLESGDQGGQVRVKLSTGSTYSGIIAPHSGDTIDAAGASITITPATPVWEGIGN